MLSRSHSSRGDNSGRRLSMAGRDLMGWDDILEKMFPRHWQDFVVNNTLLHLYHNVFPFTRRPTLSQLAAFCSTTLATLSAGEAPTPSSLFLYINCWELCHFSLRALSFFLYICLRHFYCWEICRFSYRFVVFCWYSLLLRDFRGFVERFNCHIFRS